MNKTLAQKIQSTKYFQAIKKADEKITKVIFGDVSEETKARVVANIEKANSEEYRFQVASHQLVTNVMDDILADPYWREIAIEALANRNNQ